MAARRERERRRPTERRYRFTTPEPELEADASLLDGEEVAEQAVDAAPSPRRARDTAVAAQPAAASRRGGVASTPRPFSSYRAEYAYVGRDLRRIALVIGSLLLVLIVLSFILPH
jgi:hypothetical protein